MSGAASCQFRATLCRCSRLRRSQAPSKDADFKTEWFLRAAEPPEHDKWIYDTDALKSEYKTRGLKKAFEDFEKDTRAQIKKLVSAPEETGGDLPKDVTKFLKLGGNRGGPNGSVVTGKSKANIEDGVWNFASRVRCPIKGKEPATPWYAEIKIRVQADDAAPAVEIESVDCEEATSIGINKGVATVHFPSGVRQATIKGETSADSLPIFGERAPIKISVTGGETASANVTTGEL